jgi:hypothetical protein
MEQEVIGMEIIVNIDDQELIEAVKEVAIRRIADDIFSFFRAGNRTLTICPTERSRRPQK